MSRRQDKNVTNIAKKNQHSGIWLLYYLESLSKMHSKESNMPGIGSLIHEIDVNI